MEQGIEKQKTKDLVFYLHVQYRCHSSWQGSIQWMDGRKKGIFRSVLELANLIVSARMISSGANSESFPLAKWEDKEIVS